MRGASEKQNPADDMTVLFPGTVRNHADRSESTIQAKKKKKNKKSLFRCHTGACGIKGKKKEACFIYKSYVPIISSV